MGVIRGEIDLEIVNKRARFNYFVIDEYEAGIVLTGTEIKSVRNGSCNIKDSYGIIRKGEVYLLNMFIGQYKEGNLFNHNETRDRKLLLHKKEIKKISKDIDIQGLTIVPLKVYFKDSKLKVLIGVCRGKKTFDKRETIKERDIKRDVERNLKKYS